MDGGCVCIAEVTVKVSVFLDSCSSSLPIYFHAFLRLWMTFATSHVGFLSWV